MALLDMGAIKTTDRGRNTSDCTATLDAVFSFISPPSLAEAGYDEIGSGRWQEG